MPGVSSLEVAGKGKGKVLSLWAIFVSFIFDQYMSMSILDLTLFYRIRVLMKLVLKI